MTECYSRAATAGIALPLLTAADPRQSFADLDRVEQQRYLPAVQEKVAALHRLGIVHGNLTAAAIVIYYGEAYLTDFQGSRFGSAVECQQEGLNLNYTYFR